MGDYDYSTSRESCLFCHEEGSGRPTSRHLVRFLRNSSESLKLPEGSVIIAGIDTEDETSSDDIILSDLNSSKVLSHSPLSFDLINDDQNLFMIAGDTHGGQVPLPSRLFSILGYKKNALYSQGLFEKRMKKMFVSRGIGTSHVPVRLFRKPEVVVLHFAN